MWLFLSKGMLSVVQHRDKPDSVMIRARSATPLEYYFDHKPEITTQADYRYRITVTKAELKRVMIEYIDEMEYDNFKNSIATEEDEYHHACTKVWSILYQFQEQQ